MTKMTVVAETAAFAGYRLTIERMNRFQFHRYLGGAFALLLAAGCGGAVPDGPDPDEVTSAAPVLSEGYRAPAIAAAQAGSCSDLVAAEGAFADYVASTVSTGNVVQEPGNSNAHSTLRIDAVTTALAGQPGLIDAVMTLETSDPDVRFVAPANMPNYTVYFQQGGAGWDVLGADQISQSGKVQIRTHANQSAMLPPVPLNNGATFRVGVRFLSGLPHAFDFSAGIAYRPNWLKPGASRSHQFSP
jgi:hypothetical protein